MVDKSSEDRRKEYNAYMRKYSKTEKRQKYLHDYNERIRNNKPIIHKICLQCGKDFIMVGHSNQVFCSVSCRNRYHCVHCKETYAKHRLRIFEYSKKRYKEIRLKVLTHYGGDPPKCSCCGESIYEFLTIDHINNNGSEDKRSRSVLFEWLIRNGFPEGYGVLCYNCNCGREHSPDKICPHKRVKP